MGDAARLGRPLQLITHPPSRATVSTMLSVLRVASLLVAGLLLAASPALAQNDLPIATTPDDPEEGERVGFSVPGLGVDETVRWDFGDGETTTGETAVSHTYADDDTYTVTARIERADGTVLEGTREVAVRNARPVIRVLGGEKVSDDRTVELEAVAFDAGTDDALSYAWDFGDGQTGEGVSVTHTYDEPGRYVVRLTVTDGDGGRAVKAEHVGAGIHFEGTIGNAEVMGQAEARILFTGKCNGYIFLEDEEVGTISVDIFNRSHLRAPGTFRPEDRRLTIGFSPPSNPPEKTMAMHVARGTIYHTEEAVIAQKSYLPTMIPSPYNPGWLRFDFARPETARKPDGDMIMGVIPGWFQMEELDPDAFEPSRLEGRIVADVRKWTLTKEGYMTAVNGDRVRVEPYDEYSPTETIRIDVRFDFPAGFIHPACVLPRSGKGLNILRWGPREDERAGEGPTGSTAEPDASPAPGSGAPPALHLAHTPTPHGPLPAPSPQLASPRPASSPPGAASPDPASLDAASLDDADHVRDGDENVDFRRAKIHVVFDDTIAAASVDGDRFRLETMLRSGEMKEVKYETEVSGRDVILTPKPPSPSEPALLPGTRYRVTARAGANSVQNKQGETLDEPESIEFWTVVDVDTVRVHVYQVARDAPIVPGKPIATRVYVDWTANPAVHPDWQVTKFKANVKVLKEDGSDFSNGKTFLFKSEHTPADSAAMRHTANFFGKSQTLSYNETDKLRAEVRPVRERSSSDSKKSEFVFEGVRALTYTQSLPALHIIPYFVRIGSWDREGDEQGSFSSFLTHLLGEEDEGPGSFKAPTASQLQKAFEKVGAAALEFFPFKDVKVHNIREWKGFEEPSPVDVVDNVSYYRIDRENIRFGGDKPVDPEQDSLMAPVDQYLTFQFNRLKKPDYTGINVYYLVTPPEYNNKPTARAWRTREVVLFDYKTESSAFRSDGKTLDLNWPTLHVSDRLVQWPYDSASMGTAHETLLHETGHALYLRYDQATKSTDESHVCDFDSLLKPSNGLQPCPNRQAHAQVEGIRQSSETWSKAVNKSDEEGNGEFSPHHPIVGLMNPVVSPPGSSFILNHAYLQLLDVYGTLYRRSFPGGRMPAYTAPNTPSMQRRTSGETEGSGPNVLNRSKPSRHAPAGRRLQAKPSEEAFETVVVRGLLGPDGATVRDGHVRVYPGVLEASTGVGGPLRLRALNVASQTLAETRFGIGPNPLVSHASPSDMRAFSVALVTDSSLARLQILNEREVVAQMTRSAHRPTVAFASAKPVRLTEETTVEWSGQDADGDALRYTLSYHSGTGPWMPLTSELDATSVTIETRTLRPGPRPRLRIEASDGFDVAEDVINVTLDNPLLPRSVHPLPSDTVATSSAVSVSFGAELDANTVTYERLTLESKAGHTVDANVWYNDLRRSAVLTPLRPLSPGQTYTATLHRGVEGRHGHALAEPISWTFHTAPARPEPAGPLPQPPTPPTTSADDQSAEQTEEEEKAEKAKKGLRGIFDAIRKGVEEELNRDSEDDEKDGEEGGEENGGNR